MKGGRIPSKQEVLLTDEESGDVDTPEETNSNSVGNASRVATKAKKKWLQVKKVPSPCVHFAMGSFCWAQCEVILACNNGCYQQICNLSLYARIFL
jgi:hypothetical protein